MWKPRAFSGLALCLGAVAPDLEFILRVDHDWIVSHTFPAQVYFTVPVVLMLHALLTGVVLPWLLPLLRLGPPWHLEDLACVRRASSTLDWLRAAVSAFIGGVSHVFIDGFTHGNHSGWALAFLPSLATPLPLPSGTMALHDFLQIAATLVLGGLAVRQASELARRRALVEWNGSRTVAVRDATAAEVRGAIAYFTFCGLVGAVVGAQSAAGGAWIERGVIGALAFSFYGLVLAAAADRLRQGFLGREPGLDAAGDAGQ
jgi:hypothetical protein